MNEEARSIAEEIISSIDGNHPTIICDDLTEPTPGVLRTIMMDTATGQELEVEFRAV